MTTPRPSGIASSPARRALAALPLTLALLPGCTDGGATTTPVDTCNDGATFRELHLVNGLETIDGQDAVRIGWAPGVGRAQELPQGYFAAATLWEEPGSVMLTGTNELTVLLGDLSDRVDGVSTVSFSLIFPDRRDYIDCVHPASADNYQLSVDLHFDGAGTLWHADFNEEFIPGAY